MNTALIFAGGAGQRMNSRSKPKQFIELRGKPIIIYTLEHFEAHPKIDCIVVACLKGWINELQMLLKRYNLHKVNKIVPGGVTGFESIYKALASLANDCADDDIVLIHDGARPYITEKIISDCIQCVIENKSAICAVPVTDTIAEVRSGEITKTIERNLLYKIQTPQGFYFKGILNAYESLTDNENYTDDSQVYQKTFKKSHIFLGSMENIKITYKSDITKGVK